MVSTVVAFWVVLTFFPKLWAITPKVPSFTGLHVTTVTAVQSERPHQGAVGLPAPQQHNYYFLGPSTTAHVDLHVHADCRHTCRSVRTMPHILCPTSPYYLSDLVLGMSGICMGLLQKGSALVWTLDSGPVLTFTQILELNLILARYKE